MKYEIESDFSLNDSDNKALDWLLSIIDCFDMSKQEFVIDISKYAAATDTTKTGAVCDIKGYFDIISSISVDARYIINEKKMRCVKAYVSTGAEFYDDAIKISLTNNGIAFLMLYAEQKMLTEYVQTQRKRGQKK
jgi:hypothetical protein